MTVAAFPDGIRQGAVAGSERSSQDALDAVRPILVHI